MPEQPENEQQDNAVANPEQNPVSSQSTASAPPTETPKSKSPKALIAITGVVVLFALVAGALTLFNKDKEATSDSEVVQNTSEEESTDEVEELEISVLEEGKLVLPNGYADPTVVPTADGYRMYVNRQSNGPGGYLTFKSADGKTWEAESDIILSGVATGRAVVLPTGVQFYYPGSQPIKPSDPPANMFSSFSSDGLSFTKSTEALFEPREGYYVEGPTVFQLPDNSWRMYFNENSIAAGNNRDGEIWGASSPDGQKWTRDTESTLKADSVESQSKGATWKQVLHPFVLKNPKGGYIMLYNSHSEIFSATSTDGLAWEKQGSVGIHGADIDGYFQSDGTLRVYYGDFSEETGGVVYMAVLSVE